MIGIATNRLSHDAVHQPAVAFVETSGAKRLRDQRVEARAAGPSRTRATAKNSDAAEPDGANRLRPEPPTISVSTIPIVTQPSSARTTGTASVAIGRNSCLMSWKDGIIGEIE